MGDKCKSVCKTRIPTALVVVFYYLVASRGVAFSSVVRRAYGTSLTPPSKPGFSKTQSSLPF